MQASYYNKILFNKCQIGDSMYPSASQPVKVYMKSGKKMGIKNHSKKWQAFPDQEIKAKHQVPIQVCFCLQGT